MKVLITGVSGTGKTTLGHNLAKRGFAVIDIDEDDLCYWVNTESRDVIEHDVSLDKEFVDAHEWICDMSTLAQRLEKSSSPTFSRSAGEPRGTCADV